MAPERVPNGASAEGKDDPEAEGLKKDGAKSSKIGNIQKWALHEYGKHILEEEVCRFTKKSPPWSPGAHFCVPRAKVLYFKTDF